MSSPKIIQILSEVSYFYKTNQTCAYEVLQIWRWVTWLLHFSDCIYLSDRLSSVYLATVNTLEIHLVGLTEPPAHRIRQVRRNKDKFLQRYDLEHIPHKGQKNGSDHQGNRIVFQTTKTPVCLYCRSLSKHRKVIYEPLSAFSHHYKPGCRCSLSYISNSL